MAMATYIASIISMCVLCQVAHAGIYEDYSRLLQVNENETNTTLSPPPTPAQLPSNQTDGAGKSPSCTGSTGKVHQSCPAVKAAVGNVTFDSMKAALTELASLEWYVAFGPKGPDPCKSDSCVGLSFGDFMEQIFSNAPSYGAKALCGDDDDKRRKENACIHTIPRGCGQNSTSDCIAKGRKALKETGEAEDGSYIIGEQKHAGKVLANAGGTYDCDEMVLKSNEGQCSKECYWYASVGDDGSAKKQKDAACPKGGEADGDGSDDETTVGPPTGDAEGSTGSAFQTQVSSILVACMLIVLAK